MHQYMGSETKIFLQYLDGITGKTLEAVPGQSYDVQPTLPTLPAVPNGHAAHFVLQSGPGFVEEVSEPAPEPDVESIKPANNESDGE